MSVDTIGDFLTVIRNGAAVSRLFISVPHSNLKEQIALLLKEEGFIRDFAVEQKDSFKVIKIFLKYFDGASVIHEIKRVSVPGRRVYCGYKNFKPVISGLGISIMTTDRGVMTDKKARELGLGGELVCTIW